MRSSSDLPDPVIKPMSLKSSTLAGRFFITGITWKIPQHVLEWPKMTIPITDKDLKQLEFSSIVGLSAKSCTLENSSQVFIKLNMYLSCDPRIPYLST